MAWNSKIPSFDLAELEQNGGHPTGLGSMVGAASMLVHQLNGLDCSVDLKLGGFEEFEQSGRWKDHERVPVAADATPGPSKRSRAPSGGSQIAACLVQGCKADLSKCRDYHRRHKVCEEHSKTKVVIVHGQEQRFCQQCSRFHLLGEFDEVKRSCRKRLDGHNRRRRKVQQEPINTANLVSNQQVSRFPSYPQIFSTSTAELNWNRIIKTEEETLFRRQPPLHFLDGQQHFPISFTSFKESKQFPFLQGNKGNMPLAPRIEREATVSQPLLKTYSLSDSSNNKIFPEGISIAQAPPLNSDCALSLLSSPAQTATPISLGQMVGPDRIPRAQPLASSLEYSSHSLTSYSHSPATSSSISPTWFSCSGIDDEHVGTVLVSGAPNTDQHCQSFFQVGEGSSDAASHLIHFSWQ